MSQPGTIAQTRRLDLVTFAERHVTQAYVDWLNDPVVTRYSEQRFARHTPESCRAYLRSFQGTNNLFLAIVHRDGDTHCGNISVYRDNNYNTADIGIMIGDRNFWGRSLGLEAWLGACDHLFRTCGVRKVCAGTCVHNKAMRALMRKARMNDDGRKKRHFVFDGEEMDAIYASLFREQWDELRKSFTEFLAPA
ncbi:MAG: GNAT family N-acetyltransferase [Desulfovibrionaceae bacterium]|jgi:RimJ/RimL family protein N-acetyltransferase|nr:GNAT family N-acetyltransferase [Desulfovibrionaceae bacterium]